MLNFTVGPVMSNKEILNIASCQTPYFRTDEFSKIMLQNEEIMLKFLNAPQNSRCVFLTTSGTGAMESMVMNLLSENDKAIVINGGTFGQRFVDMCVLHKISYVEVKCEFGKPLKKEQLDVLDVMGCTAFLVNLHETSSGVLYDMGMISEFCKKNNLFLIVDAISAFISDYINMDKWGIDALCTSSQKALALQPGIAAIAMNCKAIDRVINSDEKCLYLSLKEALKNMERGQTPFTPAVTILLQLNQRLKQIIEKGGIDAETESIAERAEYFRRKAIDIGLEFLVNDKTNRSNAVTAIYTKSGIARIIFQKLKDEYGIWICPNGGEHKDKIYRVGHIGDIELKDYDCLIDAISQITK